MLIFVYKNKELRCTHNDDNNNNNNNVIRIVKWNKNNTYIIVIYNYRSKKKIWQKKIFLSFEHNCIMQLTP